MKTYTAEELEKWRKAGNISAQALHYGISLIKPGVSVLEVCQKVDDKIKSLGAVPSFPSQVSLNDVAAHFCPDATDKTILLDQMAKLDVGASYEGFLGDNAATVDLSGKNQSLVDASREALDAAIAVVKAGFPVGEIGAVIEAKIKSRGFVPIVNLSGHGLGIHQIHTQPTVPNFNNRDPEKLYDGQIIAIEPFATDGAGSIYESSNPTVFMQIASRPMRSPDVRSILESISKFENQPFTPRWLYGSHSPFKVGFAIRQLVAERCIQQFPPLVEKNHGLVSQAEHTVLVTEEGCEVLTR